MAKAAIPVKSGKVPGGTGDGGRVLGQVGVGTPNEDKSAVWVKSLFCWTPFVVTEPTWVSMFWRA